MANLSDRLKVLQRARKGSDIGMPLIMIMPDAWLTDEQQRQMNEAEAIEENVLMIMRDTHDPSLHNS